MFLSKLNYCGIRDIVNDWFKSYLSSWSQFVSVNGFKSHHWPTECDVPQRSVLGSLFFLIFIKDLNFAIWKPPVFHFADDTCLLNMKGTIKETNEYVIKYQRSLSEWKNATKISLNITKTDFWFLDVTAEFLTLL